jgi:hypothetical protein
MKHLTYPAVKWIARLSLACLLIVGLSFLGYSDEYWKCVHQLPSTRLVIYSMAWEIWQFCAPAP